MRSLCWHYLVLLVLSLGFVSCMNTEKTATRALTLEQSALTLRSIESRVYDTGNEKEILSATAALLQDLSYQIDESEMNLGMITASRTKSAVKQDQVAFQFAMAALGGGKVKYDKEEQIYVTVVTKLQAPGRTMVRATFQHVIYDNEGVIVRSEQVRSPEIYQEFFSKLSKAIFLEGQPI